MAKKVITRKVSRRSERDDQDFVFTPEHVLEAGIAADGPAFHREYRQSAWQTFAAMPMPTTTDEPWRRTDIRRLNRGSFTLPAGSSNGLPSVPKDLLAPLVGETHGGQIVLEPGGRQSVELNERLKKRGVIFKDLRSASEDHPELVQAILGQAVRADAGKFAALTSALAQHGLLVYVPPGVEVDEPLHSVMWGPGTGYAHFSHLLIWVDRGASLTYVHEAASPSEVDGQTLHGGITEIQVGEGANLRFVELQSWGEHVWNFTHERALVARDGQLDWIYGGIGTHLTKSFLDLDLQGEGANARMSGFFFTDGVQHIDLDTQQNHHAPNTTSDLLYKGALEGRSRTVWQGMIYVAPGAQRTDGYQANRNLVLSGKARADSIPGLEILADDVRCTHGATVGKIDPEQFFYLLSRGIREKEATRLIVEGFFEPIMQRIPYEGVRERFRASIVEKLGT